MRLRFASPEYQRAGRPFAPHSLLIAPTGTPAARWPLWRVRVTAAACAGRPSRSAPDCRLPIAYCRTAIAKLELRMSHRKPIPTRTSGRTSRGCGVSYGAIGRKHSQSMPRSRARTHCARRGLRGARPRGHAGVPLLLLLLLLRNHERSARRNTSPAASCLLPRLTRACAPVAASRRAGGCRRSSKR